MNQWPNLMNKWQKVPVIRLIRHLVQEGRGLVQYVFAHEAYAPHLMQIQKTTKHET